jgi:Spy/CpxP family protein refolding chaperone
VTHRISILVVAAAVVVALGLFAAQQSGAPAQGSAAKPGGCPCGMMGGGNMQMGGGNMQQMHSRMSAMNAQLDRDVAAMNKATGQAKVDAMAAVLNDMVQQHRQMGQNMMMGGGMGQAGAMRMGDCPMMSGSAPAKPAQ